MIFMTGTRLNNENQPEKPALSNTFATKKVGTNRIRNITRITINSGRPRPNIYAPLFELMGHSEKANIIKIISGPIPGISTRADQY